MILFGSFQWRTLYRAVPGVQLVKQRKMVKKRDRRGRATNEGDFYHYTFLVRKKETRFSIYVMKLFFFQTMGGTFTGKQQDCTKGIYALAGLSCFSF